MSCTEAQRDFCTQEHFKLTTNKRRRRLNQTCSTKTVGTCLGKQALDTRDINNTFRAMIYIYIYINLGYKLTQLKK